MAPEIDTEELLTSEKSDIYVIPNPASNGLFLVVPGMFGVPEDGKKIWIRNVTGKPVEVTFRTPIGSGVPKRIEDKKSEPFELKPASVSVHSYDVNVLLDGGAKVPAQGGSNPRIVYG
jgi:hypothetical protein